MHSSDLFERILTRFTSPDQAAAIVGDHLELAKTSKRPFWLTMSGVIIALAWRRPAIWLASFVVGCTVYSSMQAVMMNDHRFHGLYRDLPRLICFTTVMVVTWIMGFAAPYAALRFGLRSRYTKLCMAFLLIGLAGVLFQPYSAPPLPASASILTLLLATLIEPRWRPAAVASLATLAAGTAAIIFTSNLVSFWADHWLRYHSGWGWFRLHTIWGFNLYNLIAPTSCLILLAVLSATFKRMNGLIAHTEQPGHPS